MKKLIIANLKLYKDKSETIAWATELKNNLKSIKNKLIVCPSPLFVDEVSEIFDGTSVLVAGQDCSEFEEGKYTGETSAKNLVDEGAKAVLLGHSERRKFFNETNQSVNRKLKAALKQGLSAIVCLSGDNKDDYRSEIEVELRELLSGVDNKSEVIIAYEPVWAIGTGNSMDSKKVSEVLGFIKKSAKDQLNMNVLAVYGGSVARESAEKYLSEKSIDGLLIGTAAKDISGFVKICEI